MKYNTPLVTAGFQVKRNLAVYPLFATFFLSLIMFWVGCDSTPTEVEDYDYEPVLSVFLVAGDTLTDVDTVAFLERVNPLFDRYSFQDAAISGAEIYLVDLDTDSTIQLEDHYTSPGKYFPKADNEMIICGLHHYRIIAKNIPGVDSVWAETVVPDPFPNESVKISLIDRQGNKTPIVDGQTLMRSDDKFLYFEWDPVEGAGGYFGSASNLEPRNNLIQLDPDWEPEVEPWELTDSVDFDNVHAVAYIDKHYYLAGKLSGTNMVFKIDREGNSDFNPFSQFGNSIDGMQDFAWDGEYIWGAEDSTVFGFTPEGSLVKSFDVELNNIVAITWDSERDVLWLSGESTDIDGYDRDGNPYGTLSNPDLNITGLSYWVHEPDGFSLYILTLSDDNRSLIFKMNPETGSPVPRILVNRNSVSIVPAPGS